MDKHLVWQNFLTQDFNDPALLWQPFRDGVEKLDIYGDPTQGCSCALLRYQPGAQVPRHMHQGVEFLLILRGSQHDERGIYTAGSFLINPASSGHEIYSEEGCIVLAIWEQPVRFVAT